MIAAVAMWAYYEFIWTKPEKPKGADVEKKTKKVSVFENGVRDILKNPFKSEHSSLVVAAPATKKVTGNVIDTIKTGAQAVSTMTKKMAPPVNLPTAIISPSMTQPQHVNFQTTVQADAVEEGERIMTRAERVKLFSENNKT